MQDYDATLKSLLRDLTPRVFERITGFDVAQWQNVELTRVGTRRVDMLGKSRDGRLIHIELQSTNDDDMAARMAEYALAIYWQFRKRPEQLVLYVGDAPLRMKGRFWDFECRIVDIRAFDGTALLESERLEDNVIAILMRVANERKALRRILQQIASAEPAARSQAMAGLLVLARLRRLGPLLEEETAKMPVLIDWEQDEVVGPKLRQAKDDGERRVIVRQIEKRFGPMPEWAAFRLDSMRAPELEELALRLLDVSSLNELLS